MADLENRAADLMKELMSDPQMAEKIKDIMGMLGGGGGKEPQKGDSAGAMGGLEGNLANIQRIKKIYDKVMTADDPRINLLNALRPYLGVRRLRSLDSAMKIIQVSRLSSIMSEIEKI